MFDASAAPRGQLPYIVDDGETIGDSETIIAHVTAKYPASTSTWRWTPAQRYHRFILGHSACSTISIG